MAKALEYPVVFEILLNGGHICVRHPVMGAVKYTVHSHKPSGPLCSGHITEKQFAQLVEHHIIAERPNGNKDKYGNVYRYWLLEGESQNE